MEAGRLQLAQASEGQHAGWAKKRETRVPKNGEYFLASVILYDWRAWLTLIRYKGGISNPHET